MVGGSDRRRRRGCAARGHCAAPNVIVDRGRDREQSCSDWRIPFGIRLFRRTAEHRQVDADQRAGRREDRDHVDRVRRPPATRSAASCTATTASSSSSTPPVCTGRARCSASDSTTWCGHLLRGRRDRAVHPGRRDDRTRRPLDRAAGPQMAPKTTLVGDRHEDRQGEQGHGRRAAAGGPS